ncbi:MULTISPECIES: LysR family transcriptional regulator [unclassified Cyanobium]|uniref:LysR family transcriptional regulator n=1 Tax=unclassified Cyanobium TaxID=2627006 RepID=UPI0020CF2C4D|nr:MULTISPECIES: LysR family transcriptional regulator [unclassified Cyanobium]MCP9834146.1 LysR family transcriptional regulator [Cyanobium sp. La Preciosa 7G6]MCP9936909.1 LysR family transcriptional regulator [Cyanobium sp. Aljojuca 7A6]
MTPPADLNAITIFVKVVQAGRFIGASRALDIPKATISRKLAQLETSLKARLLQRTTRKVSLTEVGRLYFDRCVRILEDFEAATALVAERQAVPHGTLRLSASVVFGVTILHRWLAAFMGLYPTIQVDVALTNHYVDMVAKGMDVAIRSGTPDSSLVSHPLGAIPYWVCASPAYLADHAAPAHPQDLLEQDCLSVASEDLSELLPWSLRRGKEIVDIKVPNRLRTNDFLLIQQLLLSGSGIAFAPGPLVKQDVQAGRLVRLFPEWTLPERDLYMVYPSDRHPSPKLRAWVEFVEQQIAGEPPWSE